MADQFFPGVPNTNINQSVGDVNPQDDSDAVIRSITGDLTASPITIVTSLKRIRDFASGETVRPEIAEFLRANGAAYEGSLVQVTNSTIQFV